jgi:hypothetical protein
MIKAKSLMSKDMSLIGMIQPRRGAVAADLII